MPHPFSAPELLGAQHRLDEFESVEPEINKFLREDALRAAELGSCRTWVITDRERPGHVGGYYSLAAGSVQQQNAADTVKKGMPPFPVPVILLARLGRDKRFNGEGLGPRLLQDALRRCLGVSDQVGVRAISLLAKNEKLAAWYQECGFERPPQKTGPGIPIRLMATLGDLRASLAV